MRLQVVKGVAYPFIVELANQLGVIETLVLQQLHFLTERYQSEYNGYYWVCKTIDELQKEHYPFISVRTLKRMIKKLEDQELIISVKANKIPDFSSGISFNDQRKAYAVNYKLLERYGYSLDDDR